MTDKELMQAALDALDRADKIRGYDNNKAVRKNLRARLAQQEEKPSRLWLWKNFVDGRPEYWAFDNPYPINLTDGDPQTLGQPCGYAIFKPSRDGSNGRTEDQVLREILEPVAWRNAAIRLGEELSSVGPDHYYDMTAEQWLDWAMDQNPRGKNSLPEEKPEPVAWHEPGAYGNVTVYKQWAEENGWLPLYTAPPPREWQGLTDEEAFAVYARFPKEFDPADFARAIEAKLKEKNT